MTLNTAQYLAPLNSQQVLTGYAQGVIEGAGVKILANGTITLDPVTATTLGFLISSTIPAPVLAWPTTSGSPGAVLATDGSGNLTWTASYTPTVPAGGVFPQTGAAVLPAGITADRPSPAAKGYIRYNTDSDNLEWFNGVTWLPVTPPAGSVSSFVTTVTPTAQAIGDFWFDENIGLEKVWDGTSWVPTSPVATTVVPGRVQVGSNLQVTPTGLMSVNSVTGVAGGVSNVGVVAVVDNTGSGATGEALSANQGRLLQAQIAALITSSNIILAGLINGFGILTAVSNAAAAVGFIVGNPLPTPAASNEDFFVICTSAGTFTPPSGSPISVTQGDWLLSNGANWLFLNVGYDPPIASATQPGLVQLATDAETQAGTDATKAVTPAGLNSRVATDTRTGLVELATVAEVQAGTDNTKAVTPLGLNDRTATTTQTGIAALATQAEVDAGANNTDIVTPLTLRTSITNGSINSSTIQLSSAINGNTTVQQALQDAVYNIASASGEIAVTEAATGQVNLEVRDATEALTGVSEIATQAEVNAGTDDFRYVTPLKLSSFIGAGVIPASGVSVTPPINGNTNLLTVLQDAVYDITSTGSSITIASAATGLFDLGVRQATEIQLGGAEVATQTEVDAGTDDTRFVTPLKLATYISSSQINATEVPLSPAINGNTTVQSALNDAIYNIASPSSSITITEAATGQVTLSVTQATETQLGGAEIATQAETNAGLSNSLIVTPQKLVAFANSGLINATTLSLSPAINGNTTVQSALQDAIYNIASTGSSVVITETATGQIDLSIAQATETQLGGAEIATQAETNGGVDDTRIVTPLKLATRVATETLTGIAEIATQAETNAGTDDARIVTPLKLATRTATETLTGIAEIATQAETETGTDDTRIVSPLKLRTAAVYKSDFNAKGDILSASANDTPLILSVGTDGQYLRADSTQGTGLIWDTVSASDIVASPAINGNTNVQTILEDAIYNVASANASLTVAIAATGLVTLTSVSATDALAGVVELATPAEVVTGTSATLAVTPAGVRGATVYKSDFNAKGDILSADANDSPLILPVGANAQYLVADNTTATGLKWYTLPTTVGVAGGVSNVGITSITDTVTSTSIDSALSANQGKLLQDQISALLVANNLTLAGTINAAGNLLYVTTNGAANGFVVGSPLPAPAPANAEYFVICEQPGTFTPPSSPAVTVTQGDWLLSTGTVWQLLDVGFNAPIASTTQAGIVELADNAETQTGTDATRAVTPAGLTSRAASETLTGLAELATQAETNTGTDDTRIVTPLKLRTAAVYKSDYNAKGDILSASANDVPAILTVGGDGQYLRADSTQTTGLIWDTISASDLTASPAINGNTNIQTILEDAIYNVASANSSITVAIAATGQVTLTAVAASDTQVGVVELATSAEVVTGTSTTLSTTPAGVRAAAVYKTDFNAKGDLLSASANDTPLVLPVGADGQVLRADSAAATGLSWYTVPALVPPTIKNIDDISGSFNGTSTAFPLAIGGVAYTPNPSTNIAVYLGGVPQIPGAGNAYTVTGSTITFSSAPPTGTTFYAFTVT